VVLTMRMTSFSGTPRFRILDMVGGQIEEPRRVYADWYVKSVLMEFGRNPC